MAQSSQPRHERLGSVCRPLPADYSGDFSVYSTILASMNPSRDAGKNRAIDVVIPSDPAEARQLQDRIEQLLQERQATEKDIFGIRLALEEALVNAIKHGNQMDRAKSVYVTYAIEDDRFEIVIRDEGPGFDPEDVPDPTAVENLERPCGRGLMLMRHYMTEVSYSSRGNVVTMCKVFRTNGQT
jgi:serine/threonine-protein kinase RsbW